MDDFTISRRRFVAGAAAFGVFTPITAHADRRSNDSDKASAAASALIEKVFAEKPAPALSVAVSRIDGASWNMAYGFANRELGVRATTANRFSLGSVSKVITSTAAARLVSKGTLDLDSPISKWLPDLPEQHRQTTMRQLLTHRAGIRHYSRSELDMANRNGAIYMRIYASDAEVLDLFIRDPLVARPGESVNYSSYGYTLASLVMQAATGLEFRELIQREVATPFNLQSLAADDPWAIVPSRVGKYMNAADVEMLCSGLPPQARPKLTEGWANMPLCNPAYCWAGGGFVMTPADAVRFGAALLDTPQAKISSAERQLLFTPMTEATKQMPPLGLGWRIDRDKQGRLRWHHSGATGGGCYFLAVYPEQGLSIALAGNVMNMRVNVNQVGSNLADIFAAQ